MLSDEEKKVIEQFKNFIFTYQDVIEDEYSDYEEKDCAKEYQEVSEKILNLVEKQAKEIEELKENYNTKLLSNAGIYQLGFNDGKKSVEDKIKAKIEEAKKNYNDLHTKHLRDCGIAEQRELAKIEFGQSLLEKE